MKKPIEIDSCCGCELCRNVCPVNAIEMVEDEQNGGFTFPFIIEEKCMNCGLCEKMCVANAEKQSVRKPIIAYGGFVLDDDILQHSSSGGFWEGIVRGFLEKYTDAYVAGVVYSSNYRRTEYILSNKLEEILKTCGSKYSQAEKLFIYKDIKRMLESGKQVMFAGLPCEVIALKKYIKDDNANLYTIDFICQGPTSSAILREYCEYIEKRFRSSINKLNMREKLGKVWIPQWMSITFDNGKIYREPYYFTAIGRFFHVLQRDACRKCEYMNWREADLTLGDFHGADEIQKYYNYRGTSECIVWTEKGKEMLQFLQGKAVVEKIDISEVENKNPRFHMNICWSDEEHANKMKADYAKYGLIKADWKNRNKKDKLFLILPYSIRRLYRKICKGG